jgi:Fe-S-cluster containining protein
MSLTKVHVINAIADQIGFPKNHSSEIVETLLEIIKRALESGDDVKRCPLLRKLPNQEKYICRIHDLKPEHCRAYPRSRKHAQKTGCKGFDG